MKLLCIADEECKALWDYYTPDKIEGVDLIIACGDLNRNYLEYLTTMVPVPVLYVHGNHDESYDQHPPEGAICLDDDLYVYRGLRIVGLGGSCRYRTGSLPRLKCASASTACAARLTATAGLTCLSPTRRCTATVT